MGRDIFPNESLQLVLDRIDGLHASLRQGLVDDLWSSIPTYVDESAYSAALAAGVPLQLSPQYSTYELIGSIVATVPAGATGLIQLGSMVLPVSAGTTTIAGVVKVLGPSDTRSLTIDNAGPAALWLTGRQLPTFGTVGP